jgi:hypothetical protein
MDRTIWLFKLVGALLSVLLLFVTGRRNGWI